MIANLGAWIKTLFSGRDGRSAPCIPTLPFALIGLICVVIVIATAMIALDARLIALQRSLPAAVVKAAHVVTDLGKSGWILLPTGLGLLGFAALASARLLPIPRLVLAAAATRFGFVFTAVGLPALLVTIVKRMIGRQRPNVWVETSPFDYIPFHWTPEFASFPSGHSTTAFAAAIAIGALYPRLRAPLLMLALVIAASRVAISTHYPSDVLAGAVIGSIGAADGAPLVRAARPRLRGRRYGHSEADARPDLEASQGRPSRNTARLTTTPPPSRRSHAPDRR